MEETNKTNLLKNKALYCNFCEESLEDITKKNVPFIRETNSINTTHSICGNCLDKYSKKLNKDGVQMALKQKIKVNEKITKRTKLTPELIYKMLDKEIIGQDIAKQDISVAVTEHLRNSLNGNKFKKPNIMIVGPSGSGKTEFARQLANSIQVPIVITDATSLTAAGYVGEDVENLIYQLWDKSDRKIDIAQRGIIFIDEIDKLAQKSQNQDSQVGTRSVQESLLKIIEGTEVNVPTNGDKRTAKEFVRIDTKNILFICAGAFPALSKRDDQVKTSKENRKLEIAETHFQKLNLGKHVLSLENNEKEEEYSEEFDQAHNYHTLDDIVDYGLLREFVGRFSVVTYTEKLSTKVLRNILEKSSKSVLKAKKLFFSTYHQTINFTDEFLDKIAYQSYMEGTGARSLDLLVNRSLKLASFKLPSEGAGKIEVFSDKIVFTPRAKNKNKIVFPIV